MFIFRSNANHLGVFTEDEVKRILSVIPDTVLGIRDRAIIELLYSTGIRRKEMVNLNIDDIDFRNREIFVRKGKFDKERIVPVGDEALISVEEYLDARYRLLIHVREREALFLSSRGYRMNGQSVYERIKIWKEKAGVTSKGSSHAFRHSMASHMLGKGAPITAIQRILGHEHISTTQRYTHILKDDLRAIHNKSHPKALERE